MFSFKQMKLSIVSLIFFALAGLQNVKAEVFEDTGSLNKYGMPGEIDLPIAQDLPDGQFSVSSSLFGGTIRVNLSFQISKNLTGAFRYARVPSSSGDHNGYYWDRSFDLHYLLYQEKNIFPSIALGVRDFIGTGLYSGEYVVATKSLGEKIRFSAGIGWGRFAGKNSFTNIFGIKNRVLEETGRGGTFKVKRFFSGENSPFFSVSYRLNKRFQLISELSPDIYGNETSTSRGFTRKTDLNLGLKYSIDPSMSVLISLMHGNTFGLTVNMGVNPRNSPYSSGIEPAPMPIFKTKLPSGDLKSERQVFAESQRLLALEGIELKELRISKNEINVNVVNRRYLNQSQMIGRVVRILSRTSPSEIKSFKINLFDHNSNFFTSEITIERKSFIANELNFDGPETLWSSISVNNSSKKFFDNNQLDHPKLSWSLYPYLDTMLFDPHAPIRAHIGMELKGRYKFLPMLSMSGSLKQPIAGTLDDVKRGPKPGLPHVRSDFMHYHRDIGSNLYINYLTLNQFLKPLPNLYAVVNFGILELMHSGIRSEVIWKNNKKPYGLGLDFALVQKRGTNGDFQLKNEHYNTYLASIYYDLPNNWVVKLDAGKYLAGDFGSTISIRRTFNNGWEFGGYATLTDVPFSTYGEGSFEKGLTIKAPINWFTGKKTKSVMNAVIRPITGDGGVKLNLSGEKYLYNVVSEYDQKNISDNWKRVYR